MKRQLIDSAAVFLRYCPGRAAAGGVVTERAGEPQQQSDGFFIGAGVYLPYFMRDGEGMMRLILSVMGLTFLVDLLLLLGSFRLLGQPPGPVRIIPAALLDSLYTGICLVPGFRFLGSGIWTMAAFSLVIAVAFGIKKTAARGGMLFLLLKFALHGAAGLLGTGGTVSVILGAAGVGILFALGLQSSRLGTELIPVELNYGSRKLKVTALRDTGNTLRDPLTGERVLVAGAEMGQKLFGLTEGQLSAPADTLAAGLAPGMRLIPYRTVGQRGAMMLAMRLKDVKIGSWQGSALVAFAPQSFGENDGYQMLIGG